MIANYSVNANFKGAYPRGPGMPGVSAGDGIVARAFQVGQLNGGVGSAAFTSPASPNGAWPLSGWIPKQPGNLLELTVNMRQGQAFDATIISLIIGGPDAVPVANVPIPVLKCNSDREEVPPLDLSTGRPGWAVTNPGGSIAGNAIPAMNAAWAPISGAQWIGPSSALTSPGTFSYQAMVRIEGCDKGRPPKLTVGYLADNVATLLIDGVAAQYQAGLAGSGFLPGSVTNLNKVFNPSNNGVHTISFNVVNNEGATGVSARILLSR